jgi:hypothetical protein
MSSQAGAGCWNSDPKYPRSCKLAIDFLVSRVKHAWYTYGRLGMEIIGTVNDDHCLQRLAVPHGKILMSRMQVYLNKI